MLICRDNNLLYLSPRHVRQFSRACLSPLHLFLLLFSGEAGVEEKTQLMKVSRVGAVAACQLTQFWSVVQENDAVVGGFSMLTIIIMIIKIITIMICI